MKIIVSVTTTKARLSLFFYAFQSLKRQNYNNYLIFVNLSHEHYLQDDGIDSIPDWISGENVRVYFVKNTGSYRKLVPTLERTDEDDIVITADDDVLYPEEWLNKIVEAALLHPNEIVCGRARRIKKNFLGRYQNYGNWSLLVAKDLSMEVIPIGCAGIAYRRSLLDFDFLQSVAYAECAPTADDIWFRLASIRKGVMVYCDPDIENGNGYIQHLMGLEQTNLHRIKNTGGFYRYVMVRIVTSIMNYFGMPLSKNDISWISSLEYSNRSYTKNGKYN